MADDLAAEAEGTAESTVTETTEGTTLLTGDKPVEGDAPKVEGETEEAKADETPEGAPESYEDFTLPEGVAIDAEVDAELKAIAKDLNLPQDQAQRLADLGAKQAQRFVDQVQQMQADASAEWLTSSKSDAEFGGDKIDVSLATAGKAIEQFGSPELKALLNKTGLGNHPEMIRFAYRAGLALADDKFVPGARSAQQGDPAKRLYPNSNHT